MSCVVPGAGNGLRPVGVLSLVSWGMVLPPVGMRCCFEQSAWIHRADRRLYGIPQEEVGGERKCMRVYPVVYIVQWEAYMTVLDGFLL